MFLLRVLQTVEGAGGLLADKYPLKRLFLLTYGLMAPALLLSANAIDNTLIFGLFMIMAIILVQLEIMHLM